MLDIIKCDTFSHCSIFITLLQESWEDDDEEEKKDDKSGKI